MGGLGFNPSEFSGQMSLPVPRSDSIVPGFPVAVWVICYSDISALPSFYLSRKGSDYGFVLLKKEKPEGQIIVRVAMFKLLRQK